MIRKVLLIAASSLVLYGTAFADWASFGSEHEKLKGNAIAAVGTVTQNSRYDSQSYKRIEWYEFKQSYTVDFCFTSAGLGFSGTGTPALALIDEQKHLRIATLESSIGSIRVEVHDVERIKCPSRY